MCVLSVCTRQEASESSCTPCTCTSNVTHEDQKCSSQHSPMDYRHAHQNPQCEARAVCHCCCSPNAARTRANSPAQNRCCCCVPPVETIRRQQFRCRLSHGKQLFEELRTQHLLSSLPGLIGGHAGRCRFSPCHIKPQQCTVQNLGIYTLHSSKQLSRFTTSNCHITKLQQS